MSMAWLFPVLLFGAVAVGSRVSPADAAYMAKLWLTLLIPSKWNPSKEVEFPGQALRYEDNFDSTSNVSVVVVPTDKKSITDFGSPEQFFSQVDYLLGKQAYFGKTNAEGGFESDAVATANILEAASSVISEKPYYLISVLTRTADGEKAENTS